MVPPILPSPDFYKYFNDFYIDTDYSGLPVNTQYKLYPQPSRAGTGLKVSAIIYFPDGYDQGPERYPVLYWLHGGLSNQRQGFWGVELYHKAMTEGTMPKTIIVLVQALPVGWYADSKDGSRPIATIMTKDLVDYMDSTYRTIARREARWIEGFSMGGYGALHLAFGHPETYGAVSMIAGALLRRLDQEPIERTHDTFFDDQEYFTACHPITLLEKNGDALRNRMLVRLLSAELDTRQTEPIATMQKNMERLEVPHRSIEIKGVDHSYYAILAGTGCYAYEFWAEAAARMKSS
ncbi:hypothetical protein JCM24511_06622 [Saitozyma sp. JCM 24511]|nr:hypothetical protein JCM24511_06622 [Saitozyma sp. JCM 24511]